MATASYNYIVGATVFQVDANFGVREAIVSSVNINIIQTGPTVTYQIAYTKMANGTTKVAEAVLYGTISAALDAYEIIVLAP